jgi:hypothetical protein
MTLKEAIEKAGHEGRGKLDDAWRFEVNHGVVTFFINDKQAFSLPPSLFTDDGWEVVEPETIEVGDVAGLSEKSAGRVIGVGQKTACIQFEGGGMAIDFLIDLTLIRKGPKKWTGETMVCGTGALIPFSGDMNRTKLKWTLEEME